MNERSFVRQVAELADCDERRAETLIFAVFQELRDRITPKEASDVAAQLPMSLKMLWMSFDRPDRKVRRVHEGQFLREVARMAGGRRKHSRARGCGGFYGASGSSRQPHQNQRRGVACDEPITD
jgi:uncharacterized protein (DUF2267 family)